MTELIDLATLASLGQHFVTVEEVAELKSTLVSVQNELKMIKNFLLAQYGTNFTGSVTDLKKVIPVSSQPRKLNNASMNVQIVNGNVVNRVNEVRQMAPVPKPKPVISNYQQRSQPPPLQRFTNFSNGNGNNNGKNISRVTTNGAMSHGQKVEKFRHNFLSKTLKAKGKPNTVNGNGFSNGNGAANGYGNVRRLSINSIKTEMPTLTKIKEEKYDMNMLSKLKPEATKTFRVYHVQNTTYDDMDNNQDDDYENENYDDGSADIADEDDLGFAPPEDEGEAYEEESSVQISIPEHNYDDYSNDGVSDGLEIMEGNGSNTGISNQNSSDSFTTSPRNNKYPSRAPITGTPVSKECKLCHEVVPTQALFRHVVETHYNGEVPTCQLCQKTFTYKQGLISHMRYHDADKYDKACSFCGKKFIRKSDVIIHERRLHTGERPYHCPAPGCTQGFVRRYCLLTHVKTNHGEPFMSQILNDKSRRKSR